MHVIGHDDKGIKSNVGKPLRQFEPAIGHHLARLTGDENVVFKMAKGAGAMLGANGQEVVAALAVVRNLAGEENDVGTSRFPLSNPAAGAINCATTTELAGDEN